RKQLGKDLQAWKEQFSTKNGRAPTAKDMKHDAAISEVYAEYQALKDVVPSAQEGSTEPPASVDTAAVPAGDPAVLAKRRKDLGKQLQVWKEAFTVSIGRAPTSKDMKSDTQISA